MLEKIFGRFSNYSHLPVRLALGWIFIAHGGQKLFGLWGGQGLQGMAGSLETLGIKPAMPFAILAACAEFLGAIAVLLGIYARWGAFFIIIVMAVAIGAVHAPHGFFMSMDNHGYEYNVAIIGLALAILFAGSGRFSIKE